MQGIHNYTILNEHFFENWMSQGYLEASSRTRPRLRRRDMRPTALDFCILMASVERFASAGFVVGFSGLVSLSSNWKVSIAYVKQWWRTDEKYPNLFKFTKPRIYLPCRCWWHFLNQIYSFHSFPALTVVSRPEVDVAWFFSTDSWSKFCFCSYPCYFPSRTKIITY